MKFVPSFTNGVVSRLSWCPEMDLAIEVARQTRWLCPLCMAHTGMARPVEGGGYCGGCGERWYGTPVPDRECVEQERAA